MKARINTNEVHEKNNAEVSNQYQNQSKVVIMVQINDYETSTEFLLHEASSCHDLTDNTH